MSLEHDLNDKILHAIRHRDPVRVENAVGPGTPDINYNEGWIESKSLHDWPARATTIVRVPKYVPEQRAWHVKRTRAGGRVHVAIQIGRDVLLFDGLTAAQYLGFMTRDQMLAKAVLVMLPWNADRFRGFIDSLVMGGKE